MARIDGSCSLGRGYGFYIIVTETATGPSTSTVTVQSWVVNSSIRFSSNNWNFSCTVGNQTQGSSSGINISSNYTPYWEACGPLTFNVPGGTSTTFTFNNVPAGAVNVSYRIWKSTAYSSYDPGEMTASGTFYTTANTWDTTTYIGIASNNYMEIMGAGYMRQPTWSDADGQNDIVWYQMNAGSWNRGGITYPYAVGAVHGNASLDDVWNTHTYNERNNCIANFRYFPRIYIHYNANGGTSTPGTQTKYIGADINLAGAISRPGHTFLGWSTSPSATAATYAAGQWIAYEAWNSLGATATNSGWSNTLPAGNNWNNITLYAVWRVDSYWNDINAYQPDGSSQNGLKFDLTLSDGSKWTDLTNEPASSSFTKPYGTVATISNIRPNIAGAHYTSNNVTGNAAASFSWTFTQPNWVCCLYSAWNNYTLTCNPNGGVLVGSNFGSNAGTTNNGVVTTTYTSPNYSTLGTASKANTTAIRTVTFNANGGSCSTASLNSTATVSYPFKGWYTATSGGTQVFSSGGVCIPGTAYWDSNSKWCYLGNLTIYAQYGSNTSAYSAITLPTATRKGYNFLGWSTSSTATTGITGSYTPSANTTLYAVWEKATAEVNVKVGDNWKKGVVSVKVNNAWVDAKEIYINVNGTWKKAA